MKVRVRQAVLASQRILHSLAGVNRSFSRLFRASQTPMFIVSNDERAIFLAINPAACRLFGLSEKEAVGRRSIFDFVADDLDSARARHLMRTEQKVVKGLTVRRFRNARGQTIYLTKQAIHLADLPFGIKNGILTIAEDVTEQVELERRQREIAAQIETQIQSARAMGLLAGDIGHSLNNILYRLTEQIKRLAAQAQSLSEALSGHDDSPELRGLLSQVLADISLLGPVVEALRTEVEDLGPLTLAGQTNGGAAINIADELGKLFQHRLPGLIGQDKVQAIRLEGLADLPKNTGARIGSSQLGHGLANAIANSFQARATEVTLRIWLEPKDGEEKVFFALSDNGQGMTKETIAAVKRGPVQSTKSGGHGFGLFSFLSQLSGQGRGFELNSTLGQGTTLTFWLAKVETAAAQSAPAPVQEINKIDLSQAAQLRALVIDDDRPGLAISAQTLKAIGLRSENIGQAAGGDFAELKSQLERFKPHLIVTDWRMPEYSGLDVIKWVVAQSWSQGVEFLVVTGDSNTAPIEQELERLGITPRIIVKGRPGSEQGFRSAVTAALLAAKSVPV